MDIKTYHALPEIGSTLIKKMDQSMSHAKHYLDSQRGQDKTETESPDFIQGRIFHTLVLEPEKFDDDYFLHEKVDKRTKAGKAKAMEIIEQAIGKTIINFDQLKIAEKMRDSVFKHPVSKKLIDHENGFAEHTIIANGYKCRPDFFNVKLNTIVDLKSTKCGAKKAFSYDIKKYGYDLQQSHYQAVTDNDAAFLFVVTEKTDPFVTCVYKIDEKRINEANERRIELLRSWEICNEYEIFTGYYDDICTIY